MRKLTSTRFGGWASVLVALHVPWAVASCRSYTPQSPETSSGGVSTLRGDDQVEQVFVADLDNDHVADSIVIQRLNEPFALQIAISGSIQAAYTTYDGDFFPEIVDTADLNLDGVQDLLIVDTGLSSVDSYVMLVRRGSLSLATRDKSLPVFTMSYGWDPTFGHGECRDSLLPRVIRTDQAPPMVSVARGEALTITDCLTPPRDTLVIWGNTLRPK